jgi:hypothetical protein
VEGVIVYWRTRTPGVVLTSVIDPELAALAESLHESNYVVCRRWCPPGVTGWRYHENEPWRPPESCPLPALRTKFTPPPP